jgi:Protein of unknown function (DUF3500)
MSRSAVNDQYRGATLMTFTAMCLFDALDERDRRRIVVPFSDDQERSHWNFLPESGRRGIPLRDMTHAQQIMAHRLLCQGLAVEGYAKVLATMNLEHLLREINQPVMGHLARDFRDPGAYFLTFFGQPQPDSVWGWRLVGHHISLNFTVHEQERISATPMMIGAEPARVGVFRPLAEEEDLAFALLRSLTAEQRDRTVVYHLSPADFVTRTVAQIGEEERPERHGVGRRDIIVQPEDAEALRYIKSHPRGVAFGELDATAQARFTDLLESYVARVHPTMLAQEMDRIAAAGTDALHFAWAGGTDYADGHYYRIQGPVTLIEFNNTEDDANHAHSVWRDPTNDFGRDLLMEHLVDEHRDGHHHHDHAA